MITSTSNRHVKFVRALQARRTVRWEEGLFVLEGYHLAQEVVTAGLPAHMVFHTDHLDERGRGLVNSLARLGAEVHPVSEGVMKAASDTESPAGLLLVIPMPKIPTPESADLVLVLDRISDPGNLGTILRTALAAGIQVVYLTKGSVDPYNPKVVRAAVGANLRLPIDFIEAEGADALTGLQVLIAERGAGSPYDQIDWSKPTAVVIGSEARGPGETMRSIATGAVHIPIREETESLNAAVAAGVILFEAARERAGGKTA